MVSPTGTYQIEETADGSPTLRLAGGDGFGESMHNLKGALSETLYIYRLPLTHVSDWQLAEPRVLSLGLGLGYNELLVAAHFLERGHASWKMVSYESVDWLREQFLDWLFDRPPVDPQLAQAYTRITELLAAEFRSLNAKAIKSALAQQMNLGNWILAEALKPGTPVPFKCHTIFYDAFSSHTCPELWEQTHLEQFLEEAAAVPCALATYAATGALTRALRSRNFEVHKVPGFGGKRQSTLAIRPPQ